MARILCFGDSITYGQLDHGSAGWVERLKQCYLKQHDLGEGFDRTQQETLVYNLGIASETTDGLEKRFANELTPRISKKSDNIIILSYGINDLTKIIDRFGKTKNRVPLEYFVYKLQNCVDLAHSKNLRVILTTILPFAPDDDGVENFYRETRFASDVERYNQAIKSICKKTGCTLLDLFYEFLPEQSNEFLASDGLHPNQKGHQLVFDRVKDLLDTLI